MCKLISSMSSRLSSRPSRTSFLHGHLRSTPSVLYLFRRIWRCVMRITSSCVELNSSSGGDECMSLDTLLEDENLQVKMLTRQRAYPQVDKVDALRICSASWKCWPQTSPSSTNPQELGWLGFVLEANIGPEWLFSFYLISKIDQGAINTLSFWVFVE